MKSSSASLALCGMLSLLGVVACSPDSSGTKDETSGPGGGTTGVTSSAAGDGDGDGDTSTATSAAGDGDGDGDGDGGGDGDGDGGNGGTSGTDTGGGSSDGGSGPGNGGAGPAGTGGDPGDGGGGSAPDDDQDDDGFTPAEGDCDDDRADINPGAVEVCNTRDDNCDGTIDEGFDADSDGFYTCLGDCNDGDANVNPDAVEVGPDGVDNDCDGDIDGEVTDNDGDGYTENGGDCNDEDENVSPGSIEFPGNGIDDDCDGNIDEALQPCDGALDPNDPMSYGYAIGLCNGELQSASFVSGPAVARTITAAYGSNNAPLNRPSEGSTFVHLSSGRADNSTKNAGFAFDGSLAGGCTSSPHPAPLGDPGACGGPDPSTVCDKSEVSLQIKVPQNAQSFSYGFQFYSAEYRDYRCTIFDDTFLAMLASQAFTGNISFDLADHVMSVNTGFFDICYDDNSPAPPNICTIDPVATLGSTGYAAASAGATVPLTTTAPVVPGEVITLRFIIFDEGDDQLDSSVLIDNFRWSLNPSDGPGTEPTN